MIAFSLGNRTERSWPVAQSDSEDEMLVPPVNGEHVDARRLQAIDDVTREPVTELVEGNIEDTSRGKQSATEPGDVAPGIHLRR